MVEFYTPGMASPAEVMVEIDKIVQSVADEHASRAEWGTSGDAAAANAAAMARAGGPARTRPKAPSQ